jgi:hypothetical protein
MTFAAGLVLGFISGLALGILFGGFSVAAYLTQYVPRSSRNL